jgi:LuxR family maltose regulon positive regulatory protein
VSRGVTWAWLGDLDAAVTALRRALVIARATGRDWAVLQCLAQLATAAAARMDMRGACAAAEKAVPVAVHHGWTRSLPFAVTSLVLGWAAHYRMDDVAVAAAAPAVRLLEGSYDPAVVLRLAVYDAMTGFDRTEDRHAVVAALRQAWQERPAGHTPPTLVAATALEEQRMAMGVGEPTWAWDVVERAARLLGDGGELRVLRAVVQTHRGRADAARRLLAPVLTGEVACVVPATQVEAWVWEARLADRMGEEAHAQAAVVAAVTLAAEHDLLRPVVAAGQDLHHLLAACAGRFGRHEEFAARVHAAVASHDQQGMDALTRRELQLLVELPSPRTAEEIAASMFVSVNTVKTHLRGIYRKLGANSRREAIVLARRRGLL